MKLSGQATVSSSTDDALNRLIARQFPAASAAGSFSRLDGLTGQAVKVELNDRTLLARARMPGNPIPGVDRRREHAILRKLAGSGLAPDVCGYNADWLLLAWQPGETLSSDEFEKRLPMLAERLVRLHQQPPSGYRLRLLPLLERYWQLSDPMRRHIAWHRALRRCRQQGEPHPLRLALLHLDIHAGNLIAHRGDIHLIDWEYASDGDVALELAAIVAGNGLAESYRTQLTLRYATLANMDTHRLHQQTERWLPWVRLLMASWYERRWQHSGDETFYTLAAEAWQRV
ncbi:thiamine kinase [Erwinia oleae]|uniref:thiamine kinase n=1 Tax=Erwinia oleae TaxID=796334 RepID=UPI001F2C0516|nr:thiamine kinase [Erwinia oleae]